MTTKVEADGGHLVIALGETWGHCPTIRLCLFWSGNVRAARLIKSPHMAISTIHFQVSYSSYSARLQLLFVCLKTWSFSDHSWRH